MELAAGDVLDKESLIKALDGCFAAFYLVHSMIADPKGYTETDRQGARNMAEAAAQAKINRIIYLGGLGGRDDQATQRTPAFPPGGGPHFTIRDLFRPLF